MTPEEHYELAEQHLDRAEKCEQAQLAQTLVQVALVHATLANTTFGEIELVTR